MTEIRLPPLTIPANDLEAFRSSGLDPLAAGSESSGIVRILLVDGDTEQRTRTAKEFAAADGFKGGHLVEAGGIDDALGRLREGGIDCAILVCPVDDDHHGLVTEISLRQPELPLVAIVDAGYRQDKLGSLRQHVDDIVSLQEVSAETLLSAASQACGAKRREQEILRRATLDPLTGLPNLRVLNQRLDQVLQRSARHRQPFGVAVITLNDLGSEPDGNALQGRAVLEEAAARLACCLRKGDLLARTGVWEFVALIENLPEDDLEGALSAVGRLTAAIENNPFVVRQQQVELGIAVGLALYPRMADNTFELLNLARANAAAKVASHHCAR